MLEQAGFAPESLEAAPEKLVDLPAPRKSRFGLVAWLFALVAALFWMGAGGAYLWGFLGLKGILALGPGQGALAAAALFLPPLFFIAIAAAFTVAHRMGRSTEAFQDATRQLFAADETVSRTASRLGRSVRHELDALNAGLDGAFGRLRSLETALENQIAALDEAGARAGVRGEAVAATLAQESQRLEVLSNHLTDAASQAAEIVTNQSAHLKTTIDIASDALKETAQSLSGHFIEAAARATDVMADRSTQMKATIDSTEHSLKSSAQAMSDQFVEAASRASQTLANRSAQLKVSIDTAEASLQAMTQTLSERFTGAAASATELVAGRAAQLKATIETAEGSLKMAGQSLDVHAAKFRATAQEAADAPLRAAQELDGRAKKIEEVAEGTMARAEFVLARQEKQRAAMSELLAKLKEEGDAFDAALTGQRASMEAAIGAVGEETKRFESVTGDAERHLDTIMTNAANRASQLTAAFGREAERLKESADTANALLTGLTTALRDAGTGAQTLIGQSSAQAKHDAHALVGEAMAQCEKLLRAAGEMGAEATRIRETLAKTIEDVERHLTRLPTVAQGEAQRIRHMVQSETDQILDLSARAISTIHSRNVHGRPTLQLETTQPEANESDGLKGLARKLTQRPKRLGDLRGDARADKPADGKWEMKQLLAAADGDHVQRGLGSGTAAAMGALQLVLSDMAVDLEAIDTKAAPGNEDWRRYLSGDRAVFARRLASAIDERTVDRIAALYRDDARFHESADAYLNEFEALLARAREGDGGGLLASSILSADTGKIYLAIAYALGRL